MHIKIVSFKTIFIIYERFQGHPSYHISVIGGNDVVFVCLISFVNTDFYNMDTEYQVK